MDPKARFTLFIANISLVVGLLLEQFAHPAGQMERNWLHGVCGFLLGLSITINLRSLILARRRRDQRV
jgi:hypothetical protein